MRLTLCPDHIDVIDPLPCQAELLRCMSEDKYRILPELQGRLLELQSILL